MKQSLKRFNSRKKLYKALTKKGWRQEQGKHAKWYCPCGDHLVVTPISPSDKRGYMNFLGDLSRTNCKELP